MDDRQDTKEMKHQEKNKPWKTPAPYAVIVLGGRWNWEEFLQYS